MELILNNTDIKKLFMNEKVVGIFVSTDFEAKNLTKQDASIETIEDFEWMEVVDFGLKNIVASHFMMATKVSYDDVSAVRILWNDKDDETFINNNFTEDLLLSVCRPSFKIMGYKLCVYLVYLVF